MKIRVLAAGAALLGLLLAGSPAANAQGTVTPRQTTADTPVAPATLEQLTDSLTLFQGLANSTAQQSEQGSQVSLNSAAPLVGWVTAALGVAAKYQSMQQTAAQLAQIEDQIASVQQGLNTIEGQISTLQDTIDKLAEQTAYADCSVQSSQMTQTLSTITTVQNSYYELLQQAVNAAQGEAGQVAPSWSQLQNWAEDAVSGADSMRVALHTIDNVIVGTSDDGSLPACASALWSYAGQAPLAWEQSYYPQVYTYVAYWYQVQVQALNLYVEAQHLLAVGASGNPTQYPTNDPAVACDAPVANGDMVTACNNAADAVSMVAQNITDQFIAAGAPYSWGTGGQVFSANPKNGTAVAWLMDINDFQSDGCTLPLTSAGTPCGGTVGTSPQFADPSWGDFSWGVYPNWIPATSATWLSLGVLDQAGTVSELMADAGFGDSSWGAGNGLSGLIVYTGETSQSTVWNGTFIQDGNYQLAGQCFLDTSNTTSTGSGWQLPACDSVSGAGPLFAYVGYSPWGQNGATQWPAGSDPTDWPLTRNAPLGYSNPGFYNALFEFEGVSIQTTWKLVIAPGWATSVQGTPVTPTPQYRWPVLALDNSMCTVTTSGGATMSISNPAGAWTMCGADMQAWMAAQLPDLPAPAPPVSVSAAPKLHAAVVSWRAGSVRQRADAYRIRGKVGHRKWRTLVKNTSKSRAVASARHKRISYRVRVPRSGIWKFKVVTIIDGHRSRPSAPTRGDYVTTKRVPWRYYAFEHNGTRRVAKAFADGRIYWNGRHTSGLGMRQKGRFTGHTFTGPMRWSGRWTQRVRGSWKSLQWKGWSRIDGPDRSRAGMPLPHSRLPRH